MTTVHDVRHKCPRGGEGCGACELTESYVLSLKERAAEKGERDLVKALNDLWFGVVQGKTVTAGDRALVERAERALR